MEVTVGGEDKRLEKENEGEQDYKFKNRRQAKDTDHKIIKRKNGKQR
jgi:hypothetical protein